MPGPGWPASGTIAESKVFQFRRFGQWRVVELNSPEDGFRHLAYYNVLGAGDWRTSDEFRALPESERPELEIWLLEQSLRLGRALGQRHDSPDDWRRGLEALDRVVALRPLGPLETQRRLLRRQLGLANPSSPNARTSEANPAPRWMEEYLLGVEAEPLYAENALVHYQNVLKERPESFWGHLSRGGHGLSPPRLGSRRRSSRALHHAVAPKTRRYGSSSQAASTT